MESQCPLSILSVCPLELQSQRAPVTHTKFNARSDIQVMPILSTRARTPELESPLEEVANHEIMAKP